MGNCVSSLVRGAAWHTTKETGDGDGDKSKGNGEEFDPIFDNPVILKVILSSVSKVEDLKMARLVCRLWRDMSLEHWRKTAVLRLLWRRDPSYFCHSTPSTRPPSTIQDIPPRQTLTKTEFWQLWESSMREGMACPLQSLARVPFSKYRIGNCHILHKGTAEGNGLEDFLKTFGPFIKYLHLDHCPIHPAHCEDVVGWILSGKLGSLEELSVTLIPAYNIGDEGLHQVVHSTRVPSLSRVKRIRFSLCKRWPVGRDVAFDRMVNCREESLSGKFPSGIGFPHLSKLYLHRERAISFRSLRTLTGLKLLWIESFNGSSDWNQRIALEAEEFQLGGVEMLWGKMEHLHVDYYRFTGNTLRILEGWMPNLKRLDLVLTKDTWERIHRLWPRVEEVTNLKIENIVA